MSLITLIIDSVLLLGIIAVSLGPEYGHMYRSERCWR
jgi:hypothetical protein